MDRFRLILTCLAFASVAIFSTSSLLAVEPEKEAKPAYKTGRGRFISFASGKLVLRGRDRAEIVYDPLPPNASGLLFDRAEGKFIPADAAAELTKAKVGEWIQVIVDKGKATIRVGERKQQTIGTFVSYKDHRLMLLLKVTGPSSYVKKYGNLVHFNRFFDDTPVFESVDGEDYQPIGTAAKVLADVKEGTVLTIHGEGDDNITRIEIGTPKKK